MASLRQVIRDNRDEICDGIAWVAIYKDGRSWEASAFYPEDGDYEDGFVFDSEDYGEMQRIAEVDRKAICVNGYYMPFGEDFTLNEIENKILYFYEMRLNQLQSDFLECFVIPPEKTEELREVEVSAYVPGEEWAVCKCVYRGMMQHEALARFREEHPEYDGCILMAENYQTVNELLIDAASICEEVNKDVPAKDEVGYAITNSSRIWR